MFKKIAFAAPLAVLALSSSMAFAATEARHTISLVATVNADDFYAVPVDFDLVNKDQDMSYNPSTDSMRSVDGHFDVLHTAGKVNARLEGVPKLIAGNKSIDLKVELNGKTLTTTSQEVVGDEESNTRYRAPFKISAVTTKKPDAGDYTGVVMLVVEPSV
ncbi:MULTISPECIES: CS1 type fimbrial major subunit [unclassified Pseudomonas]|uniref:CS1 type fimbrial major subunit n=1 Tax=unclassified Pseudomonas TaxID=196821 RepID=UPI001CBB7FDF|nr:MULTISPECIES: CS1 type fimbrial major subunit [unclassified Pseudomonas]